MHVFYKLRQERIYTEKKTRITKKFTTKMTMTDKTREKKDIKDKNTT